MSSRPKFLKHLTKAEGLEKWIGRLGHGPLAVDTETTGLKWQHGEVVGGICLAAGETAVFATHDALAPFARYVGDQVKRERELVFHNAKFDLHFLRATFGLHVPYPVHDTALMSFLLDNRGVWAYGQFKEKPHGLKALAKVFVDPEADDAEKQLMSSIRSIAGPGSDKGDWLLAPPELYAEYSALDPWYTLQLFLQFHERIRHWPQPQGDDWEYPSLWSLYETERWMILALRDMEERGIIVHRPFLEEWRTDLGKQLEKAKQKLAKIAGREINWNSTPQLRELLYTKRNAGGLGITPFRYGKGGDPSTDEVTMRMCGHEFGPALLKYREINKQYTSYAVGLLDAICDDNAIRANFKSTGARTGRTSCEEPNLQQQTRDSGVRRAYRPRKGLEFRFADYSQVEMRFAGHFANEPSLVKGFNDDPDFDTHQSTARVMYGIDEPDSKQRKFGKILNFTTLFGGGVKKVAEQLEERLPLEDVLQALRELHYTPRPGESPHFALATLLKQRYNSAMPRIRQATREESELAERREFVMNAFGRHRYIEHEKWYAAFNSKVQGTAGDQAKRGLVAVYRECQLNRGELALLLLIHDELVYETEGDPKTDRRVLELMQDLTTFRVPIIADMKAGKENWQDKTSVKL